MSKPEPDSETIDAWLAGRLSPKETEEIERWFEENSDLLPDEVELRGDDEVQEELATLRGGEDPMVEVLIDSITRSPDLPPSARREVVPDAWRELLTPVDDPDFEGMLDHYLVEGVIAMGGMGVVLKAREPELKRVVALKMLAPDLAANLTARERFLREARAAATLEHENILPIYRVVDEGVPWFAMRYAAGGTLQDRIDRGEVLSAVELKSVARQVAAALEVAHARGIVHRDIKPANLVFDDDGEHIWVCDFGIARSTEDPMLTYPGAIAGTPKFMSPEQAAGRELDGRSDLFSLGAVLYLAATGEHLFSGDTTAAVLRELGGDEPTKVTVARKGLPGWFVRLLKAMLARDPDDRPAHAGEVLQVIDAEYSPEPRHTQRRRKRLLQTSGVVAAAFLLILGLSQIAAVQHSINGLLALRFERSFTLSGKIGAYPDLRRAIRAAADGDVIELPAGPPVSVDNLLIGRDKSLTLIAADVSQRPTLTTEVAGVPGLVARSPLRVVGIDFSVNAKRDSDGILIIDGTSAVLEDCHFRARRNVLKADEDIKSRAVELRGNAEVEIVHCDFDLHDTNAVTVLGHTGKIRIRDTRIEAFHAIDVLGTDSDIERVVIDVERQEFWGQRFLRVNATYPLPSVKVTANDCRFVSALPVCWFRTNEVNTVREQTTWTGEGNTFPMDNSGVQIGRPFIANQAAAILSLEAFGEPAYVREPALIELQGSGRKFSDLAEAIREAPDGATLLLKGRFIQNEEVHGDEGKVLHLRAHPDADERPTVVAMKANQHALFLFGTTTVSGLRFVRYDSGEVALPVFGIRAGREGKATVEDCVFDAVSMTRSSVGLSITNTRAAVVKNSVFRCGIGLLAAFVENDAEPSTIDIEGSVFACKSAVSLYSRVPQADLFLKMRDSVIVGKSLVALNLRSHLIPFQVSVGDSLIDVSDSLFWIPDRPFNVLPARLFWSGSGNRYRPGMTILKNPRVSSRHGAIPFTTLMTFDELVRNLPGSSEKNGQMVELFDHDKLHPPIRPESLRAALLPGVEPAATAVLEKSD